jgi:hypothetical protein
MVVGILINIKQRAKNNVEKPKLYEQLKKNAKHPKKLKKKNKKISKIPTNKSSNALTSFSEKENNDVKNKL